MMVELLLCLTLLLGVCLLSTSFLFPSRLFTKSTIPLKDSKFSIPLDSSELLRKGGIKSVAITGATGLIGTALTTVFEKNGIQVLKISTKKSGEGYLQWDPSRNYIEDVNALNGIDAVIHLAGENVASGDGPLAFLGVWTDQKKTKILRSRVLGTSLIVETLSKLKKKPKVFISASAVGYYGYKDSETVYDEESKVEGEGFLAKVCRAWEVESSKAEKSGIRTVAVRLAPVLTKEGGVLKKLLPIFLLGAGGNLGDGKQGFSWITLNDAVRAIIFSLTNTSVKGPVNLSSPNPVNNAEFTSALGSAINRPTLIPAPSFAIGTVLGEMGNEMLLGGQKVIPKKLLKAGFKFQDSSIGDALRSIL